MYIVEAYHFREGKAFSSVLVLSNDRGKVYKAIAEAESRGFNFDHEGSGISVSQFIAEKFYSVMDYEFMGMGLNPDCLKLEIMKQNGEWVITHRSKDLPENLLELIASVKIIPPELS